MDNILPNEHPDPDKFACDPEYYPKLVADLQQRLSAAEKENERLRNLAKESFDLEMDALARSRDEALASVVKLRGAVLYAYEVG